MQMTAGEGQLRQAMRNASEAVEKFGLAMMRAMGKRQEWPWDVLVTAGPAIYRSREHYRQHLECLLAHWSFAHTLW